MTVSAQCELECLLQHFGGAAQAFIDYYRCPEDLGISDFARPPLRSEGGLRPGFLGKTCCSDDVERGTEASELSCDPGKAIDDLRFERYAKQNQNRLTHAAWKAAKRGYYCVRPWLGASVRRRLQKFYFAGWRNILFPAWPVDRTADRVFEGLLNTLLRQRTAGRIPFIWFWPDGAQSCAIMTHDVETLAGRNFCSALMDLDESVGIKSSFQIVPEARYSVSADFLDVIRSRGFEINIQDLNHDGCLFDSREQFARRVERINLYGKQYRANGFRAAVLYRETDWYDALEFSYDMSIPTVGHLEVQRGGCCTVMPFFIGRLLELPVSTTQDYSLFNVIGDYSIDLWKRQLSLIRESHGLANFIVHPDYVREKRACDVYRGLLNYLAQSRASARMWIALPGEVNQWWRSRAQMKLTQEGNKWRVEGPGGDRACVAYATLEEGRVVYSID
jgi:hypothetical protein